MANFYVDLNSSVTGTGIVASPFNYNQWYTHANSLTAHNDTTYYIKGYKDLDNTVERSVGSSTFTCGMINWENNQPWRIRAKHKFLFQNVIIRNAVIVYAYTGGNYLGFRNCSVSNSIIASDMSIEFYGNNNFVGCSFFRRKYASLQISNFIMYGTLNNLRFTSCYFNYLFKILEHTSVTPYSITFRNCITENIPSFPNPSYIKNYDTLFQTERMISYDGGSELEGDDQFSWSFNLSKNLIPYYYFTLAAWHPMNGVSEIDPWNRPRYFIGCFLFDARGTNLPVMTRNLQSNLTGYLGATTNFTVDGTAFKLEAILYKNSVPIASQYKNTNAGGTLSNVSFTFPIYNTQLSDSGNYYIKFLDGQGKYLDSVLCNFVVDNNNGAPVITRQPTSQKVALGKPISLSVVATGPGLTYDWRKDDRRLMVYTPTYYKAAATNSDFGLYSVDIDSSTNLIARSNYAEVSLLYPPTFQIQPFSQTLILGEYGPAVFSCQVREATSYQWYKNNNIIPGATGSSYAVYNVQAIDDAQYQLKATNDAGTTTSQIAALTVIVLPIITQQPVSQTINIGQTISFSVVATGQGLTYNWRKNGSNIVGATASTYSKTAVNGDNGNYDVIVTNSYGSVGSTVATLTLNSSPVFTVQPQSQAVLIGSNLTLSCTVTGTTPITYQWYKDNVTINGATNSSYVNNNIQSSQLGTYKVIATNIAGSSLSNNAVLSLLNNLNIVTQPISQNVTQGSNVTFTISVIGGNTPYFYQWYKNNNVIPSAPNSSSYTINNVINGQDDANYSVKVIDNNGSEILSNIATLTVTIVCITPTIVTQPTNISSVNSGETITFTINATGSEPLTYQWYKNAIAIVGPSSQNSTYSKIVTSDDQGANFNAKVSNGCGLATSNNATVTTVNSLSVPIFQVQPTSAQTLSVDQILTIYTSATGYPIPIYSWYKDGTFLVSGLAPINQYQKTNITIADTGSYYVIASNSQGSTNSNACTLTVTPSGSFGNLDANGTFVGTMDAGLKTGTFRLPYKVSAIIITKNPNGNPYDSQKGHLYLSLSGANSFEQNPKPYVVGNTPYRDVSNDIFLFSNKDNEYADGYSVTISGSALSAISANNTYGTELIFRYTEQYATDLLKNEYTYYTGNKLRNVLMSPGQWYSPDIDYPVTIATGINRFLLTSSSNNFSATFVTEDWGYDDGGQYRDNTFTVTVISAADASPPVTFSCTGPFNNLDFNAVFQGGDRTNLVGYHPSEEAIFRLPYTVEDLYVTRINSNTVYSQNPWALYLTVDDSSSTVLETSTNSATYVNRTGINDILLLSANRDPVGTQTFISMSGFTNNIAGTELIFKYSMDFASSADRKNFSYYSGYRNRNIYMTSGLWNEPSKLVNMSGCGGINRILFNDDNNSFLVEDWGSQVDLYDNLYTDGGFRIAYDEFIPIDTGRGHIGAFYFGSIHDNIFVETMQININFLQPIVSIINSQNVIISNIDYLPIYFNLLEPKIYAFQDFKADFVGVPRIGSSPLTVDFTALVTLSPNLKSKYRIKEYIWCFDYNPLEQTCKVPLVTTTQNPYTHIYYGNRGKKYTVTLKVNLELI